MNQTIVYKPKKIKITKKIKKLV